LTNLLLCAEKSSSTRTTVISDKNDQQCQHDKRWIVYSQRDLASAIGVDESTIAQWVRSGLSRKRAGKNRYKYCITCAAAWERSGRGAVSDSLDELIAAGGDSPGLERFRNARAELAEMDVKARRKSLLPRDMAHNAFGRVMSLLRQYAERLSKRHGPEEALSFRETLNECRQVIDNEFGDNDLQTECPPGDDLALGWVTAADCPTNKRVGRKRTDTSERTVQRRTIQAPPARSEPVVVRGFGCTVLE
jgi:transcriptional regulator with XRE-family HTH domain